jgi:predicted DNA-binding transcriptional regulator YafY
VAFYFENLEYLAQWLLGFGTQAEVIEPAALRDSIRKKAEDLVLQYEDRAGRRLPR